MSKAFWTSKTLWGMLVAIVAQALAKKGLTVDADGLTNDIISLVGIVFSVYGRIVATQPLSVSGGNQ